MEALVATRREDKMQLRDVLESMVNDGLEGYKDFTRLQVDLRVQEFDIDKAIDRIVTEFSTEEIIERLFDLGIKRPEVLELASEHRESLPIDFLMRLSL